MVVQKLNDRKLYTNYVIKGGSDTFEQWKKKKKKKKKK